MRRDRRTNARAPGLRHLRHSSIARSAVLALALALAHGTAAAQSLDSVIERLDRLEQENLELRREIDALKVKSAGGESGQARSAGRASDGESGGYVRIDPAFGYQILDPTTDINRKQRLILDRRRDGTLTPDSVHLQGAVTAIANFQSSNEADKFGYLMRHPTASNQVGKEVSEAAIHSAQLGFTAMFGDWVAGHAEMLFDPEQSFGEGTNTDLERMVHGRSHRNQPLERHLRPATPGSARARQLQECLAPAAQAAPCHGRPRSQPA